MPTSSESPGPQLSNYRIIREIARGGMGIVYEAEQRSLGRRVALKTLAQDRDLGPNAEKRFEMEARSAASLHHTNIVPVFEIGQESGVSFYAMQFIDGIGLDEISRHVGEVLDPTKRSAQQSKSTEKSAEALTSQLVQSLTVARPEEAITEVGMHASKTAKLYDAPTIEVADTSNAKQSSSSESDTAVDLEEDDSPVALDSISYRTYCRKVATIGQQVASALEHAHERGVIHRDIKPSNLLLDINGTVWITDFGLAKVDESDLTQTGNVVGTLRYVSPERLEGICDERADIYALGISLYELLVGRPVYTASERASLFAKIRQGPPERLRSIDSRIPKDLQTIIEKAIEGDPDRRYQEARDLAEDFDNFLEGRPIQAKRISIPGQLVRWAQRNRVVASLLCSFFAVLVALTAVSTFAASTFRKQALTEKERADTERQLRENEQQGRRLAENVRDFIVGSYGSSSLDTDGKTITVYEVLKRELKEIPSVYQDDPLTQAVLLRAIGDSFESLSEYVEAIEALELSVDIFTEEVGVEDRRTIDAMHSLVNVYVSNQQGIKAIEVAEQVYELVFAEYPDDEEYCINAENSLASAYFANGDDWQACLIFESVLERLRRLKGDRDDTTIDAIYNLIQAYHWLSRKDEEQELADEFLELSLAQYGEGSLEAAKAKEVIAEAYDDLEHEIELRQEVYDIRLTKLGPKHHKTMDALVGLANVKLKQDEVKEGLRLHQLHYELCLEKFGEFHRTTVASATGLAQALAKSGDEIAAIEWLETALRIGRQVDDEDDPNLLNTKYGLAYYSYKNGRRERALELYRDIFENGFANTGYQTSRTKNAIQVVAMIELELNQLEAALATAQRYHQLTMAQEEPKSYELVGANAALAACYYELNEFEQAAQYAEATLNIPLGGEGFPRGAVRARMIAALLKLRGDVQASDALDEFNTAFDEYYQQLPELSDLARWIAVRNCERIRTIFEEADDEVAAQQWAKRADGIREEIRSLRFPGN